MSVTWAQNTFDATQDSKGSEGTTLLHMAQRE